MIGDRLLHYEITGRLGEGGMGEVYRGTDTRLQRDVAIEVLPQALTQESERLAREFLVVAAKSDSWILYACDLRLGERAEIGAARELFALPSNWTDFEPAPEGDRFLMLAPEGEHWPSLVLVDDWRAQLVEEG